MTEGEDPRDAAEIALRWTGLIYRAELSEEILRFLVDEARLTAPEEAAVSLTPLTKVFNLTLRHGMPAHKVRPDASGANSRPSSAEPIRFSPCSTP